MQIPSNNPFRWSVGERVRVQYEGRNGRIVERAGVVEAVYLNPCEQLAEVAHTDGTRELYPAICLVPWYGSG